VVSLFGPAAQWCALHVVSGYIAAGGPAAVGSAPSKTGGDEIYPAEHARTGIGSHTCTLALAGGQWAPATRAGASPRRWSASYRCSCIVAILPLSTCVCSVQASGVMRRVSPLLSTAGRVHAFLLLPLLQVWWIRSCDCMKQKMILPVPAF